MAYPALGAYQDAIQNPRVVFQDPDLQASQVETNPFGVPKPRAGGFAITYQLTNGNSKWAVRCFHKEVKDLEQRYAAISRHLDQVALPHFAPFRYLAQELQVQGKRYPIVKMAWADGQTLGAYVDQHHRDASRIKRLAERFRTAIDDLDQQGIAHGDLQHGNVLASDAALTLIDYDGMYVPGMTQKFSNELGHVNYQSPLRTATTFGPEIDRFSAIVIALALDAVEKNPDLWQKHSHGENLLFQSSDFVNPSQSELLRDLRRLPRLASRIDQFALLCTTPLDKLPSLKDFLSGAAPVSVSQTAPLPAGTKVRLRQHDVLLGSDHDALRASVGERVEVVGRVLAVDWKFARNRQPYAFVDFGDWKSGAFRLVMWSNVLDRFRQQQVSLDNFQGQWVSVTGLVEQYNHRPQIVVEEPHEVQMLSGEAEARQILDQARYGHVVAPSTPVATAPSTTRNAEVRERLTGGGHRPKPRAAAPTSRTTGPIYSRKPAAPPAPTSRSRQIPQVKDVYARNEQIRRRLSSQPGTPVAPPSSGPSNPSAGWPPPLVTPTPTGQQPRAHQAPTPPLRDRSWRKWISLTLIALLVLYVVFLG